MTFLSVMGPHSRLPYSKNIGGEKTLVNLANYNISPSFVTNFHKFHNILYANGLQFTRVFSAKLPTVLFAKLFYHQNILPYGISP